MDTPTLDQLIAANALTAAPPAPPDAAIADGVASTPPTTASHLAAGAPTFAGTRSRSRTVALEWPLFWQGRLYDTIVVQRPTTRQVADFYDRLAGLPENEGSRGLRFPLFYDTAGAPIPDAIMDALDPDDADALQGDILDFLPRQLRVLQAPASTRAGGEATAQTSSE